MCKGVCVADADGCLSLNYGVISFSTQNIDGTDNRRASFGCQGSTTKMWLYDCISNGSKYDITVDSNCTLYTTDRYQRELINGTVIDIN